MFDKISKKLISILIANAKIQSVYNFEASNFEGSPCATLVPSSNESEYHSTTENERVYGFTLRLYGIRKSGNSEELSAEAAMRELVDTVINNLDSNHRLPGLETQAGYTYLWMEAAPSRWGYAGAENNYRVAEISVAVHFSVDVTVVT